MKELIVPPLFINLLMFIVGIVAGINPYLISGTVPGGYQYQLSLSLGVAGLIAVLLVIIIPVSIRVIGSGLGDAGVMILNRTIVYSLAWIVLSGSTLPFLGTIPMVGYIVYAVISLLYGIGVFISMGNIGVGEQGTQGGSGGDE